MNKKKSTINYEGKVIVSLIKNNKVCSKKTYHNKGKWPLFYFLAIAVGGDYKIADAFRPKNLRLFSIDDISTPDFTKPVSLVDAIVNTSPAVEINKSSEESGVIESAVIKLKFLFPFTQISDISNINEIALYCDNNKVNGDPSAYIVSDKKLIDDNEIDPNDSDYILNIEWDMTFKNL